MLAERWFGIGSVVLAVAAAGIALRPAHHHHRWHRPMASQSLDLRPMHCIGTALMAPAPVAQPTQYTDLISNIDVHQCFEGSSIERVDMLISIARDGHVRSVSSRPEKPNAVSRCIQHELQGWSFAGVQNDSAVSIRYSFTK